MIKNYLGLSHGRGRRSFRVGILVYSCSSIFVSFFNSVFDFFVPYRKSYLNIKGDFFEKVSFSQDSNLLHHQAESKSLFSSFCSLFCFDFQGFNSLRGYSYGC